MLRNARTGLVVAATLEPAFDSASRNRGLLGRLELPDSHALVIAPTSLVHTFFMRFRLDILFVSKTGVVVKAVAAVPAGRVVGGWGAFAVIEMKEGSLARSDTRKGDQIVCERAEKVFR